MAVISNTLFFIFYQKIRYCTIFSFKTHPNKYNYEIGEIIMSHQHYEPEFKKKLVRLHLEEGRTLQSLSAEYGVAKASITIWCRKFSNECLEQALTNPIAPNELEIMKENRRLRAELEEAHKENLFLKKAAAFFAKEID